MAEARQLAERVDKQTRVIEEAVIHRDTLQEEVVTEPLEPLPAPKVSPATCLASSSALEALLQLARTANNTKARVLAEKVDQERKTLAGVDQPGVPAHPSATVTARDTGLKVAALLEQTQVRRVRSPSPARGTRDRVPFDAPP
eukprot:2674567-Amphidinium_carterae.1